MFQSISGGQPQGVRSTPEDMGGAAGARRPPSPVASHLGAVGNDAVLRRETALATMAQESALAGARTAARERGVPLALAVQSDAICNLTAVPQATRLANAGEALDSIRNVSIGGSSTLERGLRFVEELPSGDMDALSAMAYQVAQRVAMSGQDVVTRQHLGQHLEGFLSILLPNAPTKH